jgi:hypothetical protein
MSEMLLNIISLQQAVLEQTSLKSLAFFMAHQTRLICAYDNAVVFSCYRLRFITIESVAGGVVIDKNTPYTHFLQALIKAAVKGKKPTDELITYSKSDFDLPLQDIWPKAEKQSITFRLFFDGKNLIGGCLLFRETDLVEADIKPLDWVMKSYDHAFRQHFLAQNGWTNFFKTMRLSRFAKWMVFLAIVIILCLPVKQTVVAPATITAKDPVQITAPMEGVIDHIVVKPDQRVLPGTLLFDMEKRDFIKAHELAIREFATIKAKLANAISMGFSDLENRADIHILKAELAEKQLEVNYTNTLLKEAAVTSPISGIAVIDHPDNWMGKPVQTGEKILEIADKKHVVVSVWLPVNDAIEFKKGDRVKVYLQRDPLSAIDATVLYSSFNAEKMPDNTLAYKVTAVLDPIKNVPRIGSEGTAKIIGHRVSFFYYLFRKPIMAIRQWVG